MYLLDTNVISELRKKDKANKGVLTFIKNLQAQNAHLFLSVITIGELRRGVEMIRHRNDIQQSNLLEKWLTTIIDEYAENILDFTSAEAQIWATLRVPHHENSIDKQIAATAITCGLTLVTRNVSDFSGTGVKVINPFVVEN